MLILYIIPATDRYWRMFISKFIIDMLMFYCCISKFTADFIITFISHPLTFRMSKKWATLISAWINSYIRFVLHICMIRMHAQSVSLAIHSNFWVIIFFSAISRLPLWYKLNIVVCRGRGRLLVKIHFLILLLVWR